MKASIRIPAAGALLLLLTACASMDLERAAFGELMRLQCERSEARGTCNGDFGGAYAEWQDNHAAYLAELELADSKAPIWHGIVDTSGLPELAP